MWAWVLSSEFPRCGPVEAPVENAIHSLGLSLSFLTHSLTPLNQSPPSCPSSGALSGCPARPVGVEGRGEERQRPENLLCPEATLRAPLPILLGVSQPWTTVFRKLGLLGIGGWRRGEGRRGKKEKQDMRNAGENKPS